MAQGPLRISVYLLCFFSGICALTYEVLWIRQLGLIFGVTSWALATVLAAFMGGLAVGSYLFGRIALSTRRGLALFGFLEAGIGISALLLPLAFRALSGQYAGLYRIFSAHPSLFLCVRFAILVGLLALPCVLMGGTLAVLAKVQSRSPRSLGWDIGFLYGWNTLGAVVGTLCAGFWWIAEWGLQATTRAAAAASITIGIIAFLLDRAAPRPAEAPEPSAVPETRSGDGSRGFARLVLLVLGISGFCALGYEVLWARTLVFYLHNSTYAFTAMLACFLLGIGLGSLLPSRWVDRVRRPAWVLAATQLAIGALTLVALLCYPALPKIADFFIRLTEIDAWWKALAVQGTQAALTLLPAAFFMGLSFPVAVRLYSSAPSAVSRDVGTLYSANTLGAIAGSVVVGFLLLPTLGLIGSFRLLIALNAAAGLLVLLATTPFRRLRSGGARAIAAVVAALAALAVPGDVFYQAFRKDAVILFYKDGVADTVMVKARDESSPVRALYFSDARGAAGTMTNPDNRVFGHLPLLLHGKARRVLTICFGVGNTLAAIAVHPEVEKIDAVELSPNVLEAAAYFPTNDRAWENPKVEVHVQDGRNYLLGVEKKYDVIQLEPPEIHTDGVVYLYTREFYELARRRLRRGGLICQWANVMMMPLREQKMLIRTFLEVFPHGTVWMPRLVAGQILLVGGDEEFRIDYGQLRRGFAVDAVRQDLLRNAGITTHLELLASFKLSPAGARAFSAGVPVITDDRTLVDFSSPRSMDANYGLSNAFSGMIVPTFLPGGWLPTRDYQVEKLAIIASAMESVVPLLENFDSAEEKAQVEQILLAMSQRFHEVMGARIEEMKTMERPMVNM